MISSGCEVDSWKGDGFCDDGNNNEECKWDGGDCCGYDVNTNYCTDCKCLDPTFDDTLPTMPTTKAPLTPSGCFYPTFAGDGYCNDVNNEKECEWDGGDCCGENVNTFLCFYCYCLDPTSNMTTSQNISTDSCLDPEWINDGFCDDENNNEACEWDGGDCCGSDVDTLFCTQCECHKPTLTTTTSYVSTTANSNTPSDNYNPNDTCKYPPFTNHQTRIVGGVAAIAPIPWQAFVVVDNMYSCGGTILDNLTILCAAHCFPNLDSPSTVRVGSLKRWNGGQVL